jgi:hypothetical protein
VKCHPSGKGNAINTFFGLIDLKSAKNIGLVIDADLKTHGGGLSHTVKQVNIELNKREWDPLGHRSGGGFHAKNTDFSRMKVGVWVMPNNTDDGYLENFLVPSIVATEGARYGHASQQTRQALATNLGFPAKKDHLVKAEIGAWLAWQNPPRMSFAKALSGSLFDRNAAEYSSLVNWVKWLFL